MPELPEVETTVRGLRAGPRGTAARVHVEPRRADLRRAIPRRPSPAASPARVVTGLGRRAKYGLIDDRSRRHDGLSPRHVGPVADRPRGDRRARSSGDRHRRGDGGWRSTTAPVRLARPGAHRRARPHGRRSRRWVRSRWAPAFDGATCAASDSARRAQARRSRRCCSTSAIVAGLGNIYVCEALNLARGSRRAQAAGLIGRGKARRACRRRCRTVLEPRPSRLADRRCAIMPGLTGELGYFSKQWRVYGREGEPCRGGCTAARSQANRPRRAAQPSFCAACQK